MAFNGSGAELAHLTPRPIKGLFGDNYIALNTMDFTQQFLPEVYEKEVERYGKRTVGGFLRMVGAEMPMSSDRIVWSEQGRLHVAFDKVDATSNTNLRFIFTDFAGIASISDFPIGVGMTLVVSNGTITDKVYVTAVTADVSDPSLHVDVTVAAYGSVNTMNANLVSAGKTLNVFVYGSEFKKGSQDGGLSIDAPFSHFENKPIILRDKYSVKGSDVAQIGWVEVTTEMGTSGYLWYLKSEHEARLRFEDQLEMAMVEAEKASATIDGGNITGSEGLFAAIEDRGLIYNDSDFDGAGGLGQFDDILAELDKQGAIEENMLFLDRQKSLEIDNMLAAQNSYGAGGTSYGVFNNEEDMALNLGFSGFRRGSYDFYKTDWKYLNDSTTRGSIGDIEGVLVPAGTSTVYDEQMGQNVSRPFLHVRYRASEAEDRRMKSWITGSVGGNYTSAADEMNVHFLSERALCVQAANNFLLLKKTA